MEPNRSSTNYESGDREVERVTTMDDFWDLSNPSPMYTGRNDRDIVRLSSSSSSSAASSSEIDQCPPRTLSLPHEWQTISRNNAFSPLQREPPSDLHSPYFAPEILMVINHHSFYNQQRKVPCECMDFPQYLELYAPQYCWREETFFNASEIIQKLRWMHDLIRKGHDRLFPNPPLSVLNAMGHIESVLGYANELLRSFLYRPGKGVTDSTLKTRAILAVDRLTMALQLFVKYLLPHIEELNLQAHFNSTAKRLFAFGLHYRLLWEGHPKLESFCGYHENLLGCPAPRCRDRCENGDSHCVYLCPRSLRSCTCSSRPCSPCSSSFSSSYSSSFSSPSSSSFSSDDE